MAYAGQSPAPAPTPQAAAAPATSSASKPSSIVQPALDNLQQTLGALKIDKWKGGSVRGEATANISSIQKDLQGTLPHLLADADAAPGSLSKLLPAYRNIDLLYDVLVRVEEGARVSAPVDQVNQLQEAMTGLEKARRSLSDQLEETSAAQEKQLTSLQASLKAQASPVCPAPPPAPVCPTPAKKTAAKKRKPATTTQPSTSQPPGTNKPQN